MAAGTNATLLEDLLDPQVVVDYIDAKLIDNIRLSPLARLDYSLAGRPGDEITLPQYSYVGDSEAVNEGADIPIAKITQSTEKVKIHKIGRAIEFSDEAVLSGYGDIADEAARQVVESIDSRVESELISAMSKTAKLSSTYTDGGDPADGIADALTLFGEDIDGEKVAAIPPEFQSSLRKSKSWVPNTEIGAEIIVRGTVGMVHGCQLITSNRLKARYVRTEDTSIDSTKTYYTYNSTTKEYTAVSSPSADDIGTYYEYRGAEIYIIKPGALAIFMKRDTLVEFDRDIISEMNYIKASKLFAPYVYDKSKLIKIAISES